MVLRIIVGAYPFLYNTDFVFGILAQVIFMNMKRIANIMIPIILVLVIGIALYKVITIQMEYQEAEDEYNGLEAYVAEAPIETVQPREDDISENKEITQIPKDESGFGEVQGSAPSTDIEQDAAVADQTFQAVTLHINEEGLRAVNGDYCAWLRIPALNISYPLVAGTDNEYYLHHTFENKDNGAGCLFVDCETAADFSDRNTFIYGHNMKNGSMFGGLKRFRREQGLCAADPYFYIYRGTAVYQYEIFAYYTTEYNSSIYRLIDTEEEYDLYVSEALRLTEYVPSHNLDFSQRPDIVTLSTCSGSGGTTERMVVHGVLVNVE